MDQTGSWEPDDESRWVHLLHEETYDTSWQYDAQGKVLTQTDAKGNLQKTAYNLPGRIQCGRSGATNGGRQWHRGRV
nr:hypothetical protein [Paenibacillus larvae]